MKKIRQTLFQKAQITDLFSKPAVLVLMVLFIISSCSPKEEVELENAANPENSLRGIEDAPAESGFFIFRDSAENLNMTIVDERTNLTATLGHPPTPLYCGGSPLGGITSLQWVVANDQQQVLLQTQGVFQVYVYQGVPDVNDFSTWCPFFSDAQLLAEGEAQSFYTDNDVYGSGSNQVSTWGLRSNGRLVSPLGEDKQFSGHVLFTWNKDDDFGTIIDRVVSVSVQLN